MVSQWLAVNQGAFCILVVCHYFIDLADSIFNITAVALERCYCELSNLSEADGKPNVFVVVLLVPMTTFGSSLITISEHYLYIFFRLTHQEASCCFLRLITRKSLNLFCQWVIFEFNSLKVNAQSPYLNSHTVPLMTLIVPELKMVINAINYF